MPLGRGQQGQSADRRFGILNGRSKQRLKISGNLLDRTALEKRFNYPLKPYYVVLTAPLGDTTQNTPPRLTVPPMDEGPHRSYAIQWFSFAAISIIGTILFLRRK